MTYHAVASSSASPEWPTPQWLVDLLAAEFGPFDLDPAATAENAKAPKFYTAAEDGLSLPWEGRVFCNPPYGRTDAYGRSIGDWMAKARAEASGRASVVVCVVPARVGTRWWREATERSPRPLVRIWPGRIKWRENPAPFANAIIVFGRLSGRHGTVLRTCLVCGRQWFPARNDARTCSTKCRKALSRFPLEKGLKMGSNGHTYTMKKAPLLTREEAAALLGVSLNTVRRMENDGRVVPIRIGHKVRIDLASLPFLGKGANPVPTTPPAHDQDAADAYAEVGGEHKEA